MSDYSNIIDHPHHQSQTRPHMSMIARAAQFSPFAALTGYGDAVDETARLTYEKAVLDADAIAAIDSALRMIEEGSCLVTITYYVPDRFKEGGEYTIISGEVRKVDVIERRIHMTDGIEIPIDDVFDIGFI